MIQKKQYIGIEIGNSLIAKAVQFQTHKIAELPFQNTASHVFALIYLNNDWQLFESHAKSNGVTSYPAKNFKTSGNIELYECNLNIDSLKYYCDFKYPYGYWDIFSKTLSLKNDGSGLICSEYIALCMHEFDVCRFWQFRANVITPAHIQKYLLDKKIRRAA